MDFNLYQALREARPLTEDHDSPSWGRLREEIDLLAALLGDDSGDVAYDRDVDRLDRTALHDSPYERVIDPSAFDTDAIATVIASLHAVYDMPSDERADAAADVLARLRASAGP